MKSPSLHSSESSRRCRMVSSMFGASTRCYLIMRNQQNHRTLLRHAGSPRTLAKSRPRFNPDEGLPKSTASSSLTRSAERLVRSNISQWCGDLQVVIPESLVSMLHMQPTEHCLIFLDQRTFMVRCSLISRSQYHGCNPLSVVNALGGRTLALWYGLISRSQDD